MNKVSCEDVLSGLQRFEAPNLAEGGAAATNACPAKFSTSEEVVDLTEDDNASRGAAPSVQAHVSAGVSPC